MNKRSLIIVAVFCGVLVAPTRGYGYTFDDIVVEAWAGSGANEAMSVVDFGGGNSYAFGYRWDGAKTSEDMLVAIDGLPGLTVDYNYHPVWGFAVNSFSYDGRTIASDGWVTTYLSFWWSGNAAWTEYVYDWNPPYDLLDTIEHDAKAGDGENWDYAGLGAGFRELADGVWDGWTLGDATTFDADPPVSPVPEPATMSVLAIGGLMLLTRRAGRKRI